MKSFTYDCPHTTRNPGPEIGGFVGLGPKSNEKRYNKVEKGGKNGKGWVQAGSGDNWEHVLASENEVKHGHYRPDCRRN